MASAGTEQFNKRWAI